MASPYPDTPTATLVELYESGMTMQEVAEACGITRQAVSQRFKTAGIPARRNEPQYAGCATCGKTFLVVREDQRYCSAKCVQRKDTHYKTHCVNGHPLIEENLSPHYGNAPRRCIICRRETQHRAYRKRRAT